jgi:hypothetical protein
MIRPAGIFLYNNTFCSETNIDGYSNGHFRNNLFMGPDDNAPSLSGATFTDYSTMDYDGFRSKKKSKIAYRWGIPESKDLNHCDKSELTFMNYINLGEFSDKTGYEKHGVELDYDIFENVIKPDPNRKGHVYPLTGYDFSLKKSSKAVDAGCDLPNITDGFNGSAPDLGALEYGKPKPHYGPRDRN